MCASAGTIGGSGWAARGNRAGGIRLCARRGAVSAERGAASVLGLAVAGSLAALMAMTLPLVVGLSLRHSVSAAADAAALAAADVAVGIVAGYPCETAAMVAAANGAGLTACEVHGHVASIAVSREFLGLRLTSTAKAGPPGGSPN